MSEALAAMMADENTALGAVVHDRAPAGRIYPAYIDYMERAHAASGKPVFLVSARQGSGFDERVVATTRRGFPVLDGVQPFLSGARCLLAYRDFLQRPESEPATLSPRIVEAIRSQLHATGVTGSLGEHASGALLAECGLAINDSVLIDSGSDLAALLEQLRYPVVLKTAAPGIEHKSDVNGVVHPIDDAAALEAAYRDMAARLGPRALVAPMIEGEGVEMLLGVSRDPQFGPMVVLGFGGVHAEVLRDVAVLQPPFTAHSARAALDRLRLRPLLDGARGAAAVDIDSFCEMAARLSAVAVAFAGEIAEIDINPVRLGAWGALGLDALVVCEPQRREVAA
jgi:acyl-CoA synthetase (NDP forming)